MSAVGLVLVVLAIALVMTRLAGAIATAAWVAAGRPGGGLHPWTPLAVLTLVVPGAVGIASALGALVPHQPSLWLAGACPCEAMPTAGVHLCVVHPAGAAPLVPLAVAVLVLLALDALPHLAQLTRGIVSARRLVRSAEREGAVWTLDLGGDPAAYATGIGVPRICVDRTWWRSLGPEERALVLAHESAHLRSRDPLARVALELLRIGVAPRAGASVVEAWRLGAELRADRHAAAQIGDPVRLASFLVAQARSSMPATS